MKPNNHKIIDEINDVLEELEKEPLVTLTKSDSQERHSSINKMKAYNLIEEKSSGSYVLTIEGYKAIKIGGFDKWEKSQNPTAFKKIGEWALKNVWKIISCIDYSILDLPFGIKIAFK